MSIILTRHETGRIHDEARRTLAALRDLGEPVNWTVHEARWSDLAREVDAVNANAYPTTAYLRTVIHLLGACAELEQAYLLVPWSGRARVGTAAGDTRMALYELLETLEKL